MSNSTFNEHDLEAGVGIGQTSGHNATCRSTTCNDDIDFLGVSHDTVIRRIVARTRSSFG